MKSDTFQLRSNPFQTVSTLSLSPNSDHLSIDSNRNVNIFRKDNNCTMQLIPDKRGTEGAYLKVTQNSETLHEIKSSFSFSSFWLEHLESLVRDDQGEDSMIYPTTSTKISEFASNDSLDQVRQLLNKIGCKDMQRFRAELVLDLYECKREDIDVVDMKKMMFVYSNSSLRFCKKLGYVCQVIGLESQCFFLDQIYDIEKYNYVNCYHLFSKLSVNGNTEADLIRTLDAFEGLTVERKKIFSNNLFGKDTFITHEHLKNAGISMLYNFCRGFSSNELVTITYHVLSENFGSIKNFAQKLSSSLQKPHIRVIAVDEKEALNTLLLAKVLILQFNPEADNRNGELEAAYRAISRVCWEHKGKIEDAIKKAEKFFDYLAETETKCYEMMRGFNRKFQGFPLTQ